MGGLVVWQQVFAAGQQALTETVSGLVAGQQRHEEALTEIAGRLRRLTDPQG